MIKLNMPAIKRELKKKTIEEVEEMDQVKNCLMEWCSNCEDEVEIENNFKVQYCSDCGERILPCSLCNMSNVNCSSCPLEINN